MDYNRSGTYWSRNANEMWNSPSSNSNSMWRNNNPSNMGSNSNWNTPSILNEITSDPVTQVNLANDILKLVFQNQNDSHSPSKPSPSYNGSDSRTSYDRHPYESRSMMPPPTSMKDVYESPSPWAPGSSFKAPMPDPYSQRHRDFGPRYQSPPLNRGWSKPNAMSSSNQGGSGDRNSAIDRRYRRDIKYQTSFVPNKLKQNFKRNRTKTKSIPNRNAPLIDNSPSSKNVNTNSYSRFKAGKSNKPQLKSSHSENMSPMKNEDESIQSHNKNANDGPKSGTPKTLEVTISQTQTGRFVNKGILTKKDIEQGLYCHICKIAFGKKMQSFKMHVASKYHTKNISRTATKYCKELSSLRSNMKIFYSLDSSQNNPDKEKLTCKGCNVWFIDKEKLEEHKKSRQHELLNSYYISPECKLCNEGFNNRIQYDKHLLSLPHIIKLNHYLRTTEGDKKELLAALQPNINIEDELFSQGIFDESDIPSWDQDFIVGAEHLKPASGWWCQVCHQFVNKDTPEAFELHCKTQKHYKKHVYHLKVKFVKDGILDFGPRIIHPTKKDVENGNDDLKKEKIESSEDNKDCFMIIDEVKDGDSSATDSFYNDESTNMFENAEQSVTSNTDQLSDDTTLKLSEENASIDNPSEVDKNQVEAISSDVKSATPAELETASPLPVTSNADCNSAESVQPVS